MDPAVAERLFEELSTHSGITPPNRKLFLRLLASTSVPESPDFHQTLPNERQLTQESSSYHYLSLRRILKNRNARDYQSPQWRRHLDRVASISPFRVYSSDALVRDLGANRKLMEMMAECPEPFSLLGKLKTYDWDNTAEDLFIVTRPVLVIPGVEDREPIYEWEQARTTYEKEVRMMVPIQMRVKPEAYFSA